MSVDYSKVIMVGNSWATRDASGEVTLFDTALEAAGGKAEPAEKPKAEPKSKPKAKPDAE